MLKTNLYVAFTGCYKRDCFTGGKPKKKKKDQEEDSDNNCNTSTLVSIFRWMMITQD